jgi:cytochrome c biogenesis protein CcmG/thiol:disulfide interchange protein DsbE
MNRFMLPLALFVVLVGFLAVGLRLDPHEVPSPLIGKPAPAFQLTQLEASDKTFSPSDMSGKVWLLNVWSTWCVACRQEHGVLVAYSKKTELPIIGLNYKEVRGDGEFDMKKMSAGEERTLGVQRANMWLAQHGNPYKLTAMDFDGRVGIDYGVYGVPESYLIDKAGTIRYKQIGPVTPDVMENKILPLVKELEK